MLSFLADVSSTMLLSSTSAVANNNTNITNGSSGDGGSNSTNPGDVEFTRAAPAYPAAFAMCASWFVVVMIWLRRKKLYHVWNTLTFVLFFLQGVRMTVFILLTILDIETVPCALGVTALDVLHSAWNMSFVLLFCVMMFPLCQEPERSKLLGYRLSLAAFLCCWAGLQVAMYVGTGSFRHVGGAGTGTGCEIDKSQMALNSIFIWVPCYLMCALSVYFVFWLRSLQLLLNRRRINIFAGVLLLGTMVDAAGSTVTIIGLSGGQEHSTRRLTSDEVVFWYMLFTAIHVMLIASAFIYAEDLIPEWMPQCCQLTAKKQTSELALLIKRDGHQGGGDGNTTSGVQTPSQRTSAITFDAYPGIAVDSSAYGTGGNNNNGGGGGSGAGSGTAPGSRLSGGFDSTSRGALFSPAAAQHTLTYFLSQQRVDIVDSANMVDSIRIREDESQTAAAAYLVAGRSEGASHHYDNDDDDDIVSHTKTSQSNFYSSSALGHTAGTLTSVAATDYSAITSTASNRGGGVGSWTENGGGGGPLAARSSTTAGRGSPLQRHGRPALGAGSDSASARSSVPAVMTAGLNSTFNHTVSTTFGNSMTTFAARGGQNEATPKQAPCSSAYATPAAATARAKEGDEDSPM